MSGDTDIAAVGALVADPGRSQILLALDDGRALPAGRLALEAGVSAATASSHLAKLIDAGLLTVDPQGRFRYYRLAGPEVGALIEALQRVAPRQRIRSLRQGTRAKALRDARTCHDHLAGAVGRGLRDRLIELEWIIPAASSRAVRVTDAGVDGLRETFDIDLTRQGAAAA
jgi:DNA-binding transcriptional ArsR family regulator